MLFGLFKKSVRPHEFADGLFLALTRSQVIDEKIEDLSGKELLTREDKVYLLMARLSFLMATRGLERSQMVLHLRVAEDLYGVKPNLLASTPKSGPLSKEQQMLAEKLVDVAIKISEINAYFKHLPAKEGFARSKFAIDHDFNPIQKALVLNWYIAGQKIVDAAFDASLKNFKVVDS